MVVNFGSYEWSKTIPGSCFKWLQKWTFIQKGLQLLGGAEISGALTWLVLVFSGITVHLHNTHESRIPARIFISNYLWLVYFVSDANTLKAIHESFTESAYLKAGVCFQKDPLRKPGVFNMLLFNIVFTWKASHGLRIRNGVNKLNGGGLGLDHKDTYKHVLTNWGCNPYLS